MTDESNKVDFVGNSGVGNSIISSRNHQHTTTSTSQIHLQHTQSFRYRESKG